MIRGVATTFVAAALCGCAAVDQYGSRIYDANLNSQSALNQEILLNIVRASKYQSPNFMAISQVSGGQTEMVTTGLPVVSFGPAQTAANHVYQISNSVQSSVQGGYQSNPLISTAFQNGMMTPVSPRTVALLAQSRPREIIFNLLLDGIEVVQGETHSYLKNDPSQDLKGEDFNGKRDARSCDAILTDSLRKKTLGPGGQCSFTKFQWLLQSLLGNGFTAELVDMSNANSTAVAGATGSSSSPGLPGHLCFNPALAGLNKNPDDFKFNPTLCEPKAQRAAKPTVTRSDSNSIKTTDGKTETTRSTTISGTVAEHKAAQSVKFDLPGIGFAEFRFVLRSPFSVMNYLGIFLRNGSYNFAYATLQAQRILPVDEPYLNIVASSSDCYTFINYMGQSYCVPSTSQHTPMLMDIVESLRNLNIQPADLNSAFTVRLTP